MENGNKDQPAAIYTNPAAIYTNEELIEKCQELIIKLAKDRSAFRMCVPPQKDDSDVLLWELTERLKEK